MNRPLTGHEVISASAGSGKTFQLAHRYVKLLALGVPPDRICALTFSRKAAGEIFESVVARLCHAASSDEAAADTARIADVPALTAADAIAMLRAVLSSLNRLHVGTLDSFMVSIVRAFPVELGVPMDFRVMSAEGAEAAELRAQILSAVFDPRRTDEATRRELFEAFKQATFGREEKAFGEQLDGFIESLRERYYRVLADGSCWGDRQAIWGDALPWRPPQGPTGLHGSVDGTLELVAAQGWSESVAERWQVFAEAVRAFRPGAPWTASLNYLAEKLLPLLENLESGEAEVKLNRSLCALTGPLCDRVRELVQHVAGCELQSAAETTQGLFRILDLFEQLYDSRARRLGQLSFNDAQYLLTAGNAAGGRVITRDIDAQDRLYIDYRLDCQLDHWLLDEFQDTSDLQWAVLHNLLDEILQDDSGRRSLFYVGDVKQSIYRWRGGNPRLFGAILEHYGSRISQRHLAVSFRSAGPVIDAVNRVFDALPGDQLPRPAVARWHGIWRRHEAAGPLQGQSGYACLIEPDHEDRTRKPDDADRTRLLGGLLREIRPVERGLSVAVLVRTNASGKAVVDVLRRECPGMTVVHEGNASILDSPVVALLISVLRFAAHPADTMAWRHVQMSPLYRVLVAEVGDEDRLCLDVLRGVQEKGFHHILMRYGEWLEEVGALDAFGSVRFGDLLAAAAEHDATGSRDVDAFIRMVEAYEVREQAGEHAVRVMTVHQSKGLGFDVVMLPDLLGKSVDKAHQVDFLVARDADAQQPEWILKAPRRGVGASDRVLSELYAREDAEACFDALCVLYVALTRAKRGLYMVTSFPGKSSRALTEAALLKQQFTGETNPSGGTALTIDGLPALCHYETGSSRWYEECAEVAASQPTPSVSLAADYADRASQRRRLKSMEPSGEEEAVFSAARLFSVESRDVVAFGQAIHELLERVAWLDEADLERIVSEWQQGAIVSPDVMRDVTDQFRRVLSVPEVGSLLSRPDGHVRLWREKSFEIVTPDGFWMTGVFDRVVIDEPPDGRPRSATIVDYKSSMVENKSQLSRKIEVYRPQLDSYRQALSRILGLAEGCIECKILFTRAGTVRTL